MNNKKILFIIYDLERGGPELRLLDLSKHFPEDLKIYICVTSENLSLIKNFRETNVNIKIVPIEKIYLEFKKIKSIYQNVKDNNISVINSFDLKALIISIIIKIFNMRQIKLVYHDVNSFKCFHWRHKILFWILFKFVDECLSNSEFLKTEIKKKYIAEKKIKVINNGIDTSLFKRNKCVNKQVRAKLNIQNNEIVIGTIANFRRQKNYPFLIDAFYTLLKKFKSLKLLCVGGGASLEDVKEIVRNKGLTEKVIFTGYSEEVVSCLNVMDIFVLCSTYEGSPNVILQAMSAGVPVISSSVGGCPELIENLKTGILFTPNNKKEFINAVSKLIENKGLALEMVHQAKRHVNEKFSLKNLVNNYANFYRQL